MLVPSLTTGGRVAHRWTLYEWEVDLLITPSLLLLWTTPNSAQQSVAQRRNIMAFHTNNERRSFKTITLALKFIQQLHTNTIIS
jgi:hypothetical protein